jgi:hypothetical protein
MNPTRCIWPQAHVEEGPRRKRWTRAEIEAIESAGLLPQDRLELIDGELMDRRGKSRPRAIAITDFRVDNPGPADLALVCQVLDRSQEFDLSTKGNLYARAGIEEYWVLDLAGAQAACASAAFHRWV